MYLSVSDVKTTVATMEWQPVEIPVNYLSGDVFGLAVCVPLDYPFPAAALERQGKGVSGLFTCQRCLTFRSTSIFNVDRFFQHEDFTWTFYYLFVYIFIFIVF